MGDKSVVKIKKNGRKGEMEKMIISVPSSSVEPRGISCIQVNLGGVAGNQKKNFGFVR